MNSLNVNIDAEAIISQSEQEAFVPKKKTEFNPNNYLNARLAKGEQTKKLKIRLLPFSTEGGTPFHKIFIHTVRIQKSEGVIGWKQFICPTHNGKGEHCPFCETSEAAKKARFNTTNEMERKNYGDIEYQNKAKEAWIVRCIERGHEDEGVKFWLFSASRKRDGAYDKIINLFNERYEEAKQAGQEYNIFDLNNGKDLNITLTRDTNGRTVYQVTDASLQSPLSNDYELAKSWIEDTKQWDEVYPVKPYEFLAICREGGIPRFDKESGKYVNSVDYEAKQEEEKTEAFNSNFTEQKTDYAKVSEEAVTATVQSGVQVIDETDLPF